MEQTQKDGENRTMHLHAFMLSPDYERALMHSISQRGDGTLDRGIVSMLRTHVAEASSASDHAGPPLLMTVPAIVAALRSTAGTELGFEVMGYSELEVGGTVDQLAEIELPLPIPQPPAKPIPPAVHVDSQDMGEAADWNW